MENIKAARPPCLTFEEIITALLKRDKLWHTSMASSGYTILPAEHSTLEINCSGEITNLCHIWKIPEIEKGDSRITWVPISISEHSGWYKYDPPKEKTEDLTIRQVSIKGYLGKRVRVLTTGVECLVTEVSPSNASPFDICIQGEWRSWGWVIHNTEIIEE
jgi:hypothetical protein